MLRYNTRDFIWAILCVSLLLCLYIKSVKVDKLEWLCELTSTKNEFLKDHNERLDEFVTSLIEPLRNS